MKKNLKPRNAGLLPGASGQVSGRQGLRLVSTVRSDLVSPK